MVLLLSDGEKPQQLTSIAFLLFLKSFPGFFEVLGSLDNPVFLVLEAELMAFEFCLVLMLPFFLLALHQLAVLPLSHCPFLVLGKVDRLLGVAVFLGWGQDVQVELARHVLVLHDHCVCAVQGPLKLLVFLFHLSFQGVV